MDTSKKNQLLSEAKSLLRRRLVSQAIAEIASVCEAYKMWSQAESLHTYGMVYGQLLWFALNGTPDPARQNIMDGLLRDLYALCDVLQDEVSLRENASFEYSRMRSDGLFCVSEAVGRLLDSVANVSVGRLLSDAFDKETDDEGMFLQYEQEVGTLFSSIAYARGWTDEDERALKNLFEGGDVVSAQSVAASALTLNVLRVFDVRKIQFLINLLSTHNAEVRRRALVAFALVCRKYSGRLPIYTDLYQKIKSLSEDNVFVSELSIVVVSLLRTVETEEVNRKIREDLLPEMIRMSPKLTDKIAETNRKEMDLETAAMDMQDMLDENGLTDKLQQFGDMQREGADVYMATFASLKGFPFFNDEANWFLPFEKKHSVVEKLFDGDNGFLGMLASNSLMCDSDKYSFCLSLSQMPPSQLDLMRQGFKIETDQLKDDEMDQSLADPTLPAVRQVNAYVQNLYRFYKLFPAKWSYNPFDFMRSLLGEESVLRFFFAGTPHLLLIADFCFAKKMYVEALPLFSEIAAVCPDDASLFRKMGYCYQRNGANGDALVCYLRADLLSPDHRWTLKRIASCYRASGDLDEALAYYRQALDLKTDDYQTLMHIGNCLSEQGKRDEALAVYFKIDYLMPGNQKVMRAIAWSSFLCAKDLQSEKYYAKITVESTQTVDFLQASLVKILLKKHDEALSLLMQAYGLSDLETLDQMMDEYFPVLLDRGVEKEMLRMFKEFFFLKVKQL